MICIKKVLFIFVYIFICNFNSYQNKGEISLHFLLLYHFFSQPIVILSQPYTPHTHTTHTHTHTYTHTHTHTHTLTILRILTHYTTHTKSLTHIHTHKHWHRQSYTRTHTHTHTNTNNHTRTTHRHTFAKKNFAQWSLLPVAKICNLNGICFMHPSLIIFLRSCQVSLYRCIYFFLNIYLMVFSLFLLCALSASNVGLKNPKGKLCL